MAKVYHIATLLIVLLWARSKSLPLASGKESDAFKCCFSNIFSSISAGNSSQENRTVLSLRPADSVFCTSVIRAVLRFEIVLDHPSRLLMTQFCRTKKNLKFRVMCDLGEVTIFNLPGFPDPFSASLARMLGLEARRCFS